MSPKNAMRSAALSALLWGMWAHGQSEPAAAPAPADPAALATQIEKEVEEIRGLPFKRKIGVESQSPEQFGTYLDRRIDEVVPEKVARYYGRIIRKLGLYRGDGIDDYRSAMKSVMSSQAGAYYDPDQQRFYVLMDDMSELMKGVLYSHELYHGLQDQYFGLNDYVAMHRVQDGRPALNGDEMLARQCVVEGEATYLMNLWMMRRMAGQIPPREVLSNIVQLQTSMSLEQLRSMIGQTQMTELVGKDVQAAMEAAKDIPPFLLDTMIAAYLKGMGFVFAVHADGWPAVEKLYTEYPPQSTEQILHPAKWLSRENPSIIEWPALDKARALEDWELLDDDVLGEFQWRIIFREHGLAAEAEGAAAGWDGDRYAVFKRRDSDAMLLLLRTSWDSKADATEFADAYRRVLAVKYVDAPEQTQVVHKGVDVFIVEGGDSDALLKIVKKARKSTRKN